MWLVVLASLLVAAALLTRSPALPATRGADCPWGTVAAAWLGAWLLRLALMYGLARKGLLHHDPDEMVRYVTALKWSHAPTFFRIWDGMWLPGVVAYYGLLMRLAPTPGSGFLAGLVLSHGLNLLACGVLAWVAGARRGCAVVAMALAAPAWLLVLNGLGPLVELNLATLAALAVACGWAWLVRRARGEAAWPHLLGFAALLFAVESVHLQGWMFVLASLPLLAGGLWWARAGRAPHEPAQAAVLLLGLGLFPALWLVCSWRVYGDPFAFYANYAKWMATEATRFTAAPDRWSVAVQFPAMLLAQVGLALLLVPVAALGLDGPALRRAGIVLLAAATPLALLVATSVRGGYLLPYHQRLVLLPALLVLVAVAVAARPLERLRRPATRTRAVLAVACAALLLGAWTVHNAHALHRLPRAHYVNGWPNDVWLLAQWLRREMQNPQAVPGMSLGTPVAIYAPHGAGEWAYFATYVTGSRQVIQYGDQPPPNPEAPVLVCDDTRPVPGYRPVTQVGRWMVFVRE